MSENVTSHFLCIICLMCSVEVLKSAFMCSVEMLYFLGGLLFSLSRRNHSTFRFSKRLV